MFIERVNAMANQSCVSQNRQSSFSLISALSNKSINTMYLRDSLCNIDFFIITRILVFTWSVSLCWTELISASLIIREHLFSLSVYNLIIWIKVVFHATCSSFTVSGVTTALQCGSKSEIVKFDIVKSIVTDRMKQILCVRIDPKVLQRKCNRPDNCSVTCNVFIL